MKSKKWIGFGMYTESLDTVVHCMSSARGVSAPYPTVCKISVFNDKYPKKKNICEGTRLNTPKPIYIDKEFEFGKSEYLGIFGIVIEVASQQSHLDVRDSQCIIEIRNKINNKSWIKYVPESSNASKSSLSTNFEKNKNSENDEITDTENQHNYSKITAPYFIDNTASNPSVIIINDSSNKVRTPKIFLNSFEIKDSKYYRESLPSTIVEFDLTNIDQFLKKDSNSVEQESQYDREIPVNISDTKQDDIALYYIYKDRFSGLPISLINS